MAFSQSNTQNPDPGPIKRRRTYWPTAVGSDTPLAWNGYYPREIRIHSAGDLSVTYDDQTTETIKSIPVGAVFRDCNWVQINAAGSTAFAISVGW